MTAEWTEHVKLTMPPLRRTLVQLRYPPVLGFAAGTVRPIQKALADEFPNAQQEQFAVGVTFGVGADSEIKNPTPIELKHVFRFSTADGAAFVQVAEDAIAYQTTTYTRFTRFQETWHHILAVAVDALYLRWQHRLGLRYTNVIEQSDIDSIEGWQDFIADHLLQAAVRNSRLLEATCFSTRHESSFRTPYGSCRFHYGFADPLVQEDQLPPGFVLDVDSYDDEAKHIDVDQQLETLAHWNHQSYQLLHASVTDRLWQSFRPEGSV